MKSEDLIESLKSFNPITDANQRRLHEGEFISHVLEELENIDRIHDLAAREEKMAELMEEASDQLDELARLADEDDTSEGNLKRARDSIEGLNDNLRQVRKAFDIRDGESIIRPIELSVDLEIAIQDLDNLLEMPENEIEELPGDIGESILEAGEEQLEHLLEELEEIENRTLDAADTVEPRDLELKIDRSRRKLEELKSETSGKKNQEASTILEDLEELERLIPQPREPRGTWLEFLEFIGIHSEDREGLEEITRSNHMIEDPDVYGRMLNSLKMVTGRDLKDVRLVRKFEKQEEDFIDYSRSKLVLRIELEGEVDRYLAESCYVIFREASEISEVNFRAEEVVHIDHDAASRLRSVFSELNTYGNEMEELESILEEQAMR